MGMTGRSDQTNLSRNLTATNTFVSIIRDIVTMAAAPPKTGPKTIDKVREAIDTIEDKKGASVIAIKSYIMSTWPETNPSQLKNNLKKAIEKGFETGLFKRSKNSEVQGPGLSGRILLNKDFLAAEAKAKASKEKLAEKKAKEAEKKGEKKAEKSTEKKSEKKTEKKTAKRDKSASRSKSRSKSRSQSRGSSQSPPRKTAKKTTKKTAKPKTDTKS